MRHRDEGDNESKKLVELLAQMRQLEPPADFVAKTVIRFERARHERTQRRAPTPADASNDAIGFYAVAALLFGAAGLTVVPGAFGVATVGLIAEGFVMAAHFVVWLQACLTLVGHLLPVLIVFVAVGSLSLLASIVLMARAVRMTT